MKTESYPFGRSLWLTTTLFLSYLAVSISLPVVPIFVTERLHLSNAYAGLAVGVAFLATILSRGWAGQRADLQGGKCVMQRGLLLYSGASLLCALSVAFESRPVIALGVLLAGRLLLGLGESFTMVGTTTWGLGLVGGPGARRFLSMLGAGMYGSFALGGPLGIMAYDAQGFLMVMLLSAAAPLVGLVMIAKIPAVVMPAGGRRQGLWSVIKFIFKHGAVVWAQGIGFAAIGAFEALLFKQRGWPHAGTGLVLFAVGFVGMRLVGNRLSLKMGGRNLILASLLVETVGQTLLWLAPAPGQALVGSLLTGMGCSMIFPVAGAEVANLVPHHMRGLAMGTFSAFQDVAYGITGPVAGLAADHFGESVVFLIGAAAAVLGIGVLASMRKDEGRRMNDESQAVTPHQPG